MCLNQNTRTLQSQRGFLLPMALFIIVVMGVFALTLWRTTAQASMASVQEINTVQAFYAAESGGQYGMRALFDPASINRQAIDGRCIAMNITQVFTDLGLNNCEVNVTCNCAYENSATCDTAVLGNYSLTGPVVKSFYTLTSVGSCGSGNFAAERTVVLGSFMEQQ